MQLQNTRQYFLTELPYSSSERLWSICCWMNLHSAFIWWKKQKKLHMYIFQLLNFNPHRTLVWMRVSIPWIAGRILSVLSHSWVSWDRTYNRFQRLIMLNPFTLLHPTSDKRHLVASSKRVCYNLPQYLILREPKIEVLEFHVRYIKRIIYPKRII